MKKTEKINISNIIFHIDEDAYVLLKEYMEQIKIYFGKQEEGKEIIIDIENRIAEILQSKRSDVKEVINIDDINEIIEILGKPEDFASSDKDNEEFVVHKKTKKLYRDSDNAVLGGVCSGIGAYLNVDPVIIRLLFVLLLVFYGVTAIIYLILWLIVPPAQSIAQKLEMKGENFSISNIEKTVKNEYENVKHNFNKISSSKEYDKTKGFFATFFRGIAEIIRFVFKFVFIIIGIFFIVIGLGLLVGFVGTLAFSEPLISSWGIFNGNNMIFSDMLNYFVSYSNTYIIIVCSLLFVIIPLFAIIYGGFKLIFRFKANDKLIAIVGFTTWFLSLLILISISFFEAKDYAITAKSSETVEMKNPSKNILYFQSSNIKKHKTTKLYIFDNEIEILADKYDKNKLYALPEMEIEKSNTDEFYVVIEKKGKGVNRDIAIENAKKINYNVIQNDTILEFDSYFYLKNEMKWTFPKVEINIKIPVGKIIYLDESIKEQLDYACTVESIWEEQMLEQKWIMTEEGLKIYKGENNLKKNN
ncbi:MAG: PspC domain-containing protein [Bacteroidales bacterium]|jgi:phage shock protein PspC (stress-responsive transcriptional regulator)|nr:PspC domain-containing protein [Bacteroidales bacterium]